MDAAGLIIFPFNERGYIGDANDTFVSGIYRGQSNTMNTPANYGIVIVFAAVLGAVLQMYFPTKNMNASASWRLYWPGSEWTEWVPF